MASWATAVARAARRGPVPGTARSGVVGPPSPGWQPCHGRQRPRRRRRLEAEKRDARKAKNRIDRQLGKPEAAGGQDPRPDDRRGRDPSAVGELRRADRSLKDLAVEREALELERLGALEVVGESGWRLGRVGRRAGPSASLSTVCNAATARVAGLNSGTDALRRKGDSLRSKGCLRRPEPCAMVVAPPPDNCSGECVTCRRRTIPELSTLAARDLRVACIVAHRAPKVAQRPKGALCAQRSKATARGSSAAKVTTGAGNRKTNPHCGAPGSFWRPVSPFQVDQVGGDFALVRGPAVLPPLARHRHHADQHLRVHGAVGRGSRGGRTRRPGCTPHGP